MALGGVDIFNVPQFLSAPSKKRLVRLMLINNIRKSREFQYFSIQKDGSQWVAWYYEPVGQKVKNDAFKQVAVAKPKSKAGDK